LRKKNSKLLSIILVILVFISICASCSSQTTNTETAGSEGGNTNEKDTLVIAFSGEPTSMSTLSNELMESIYSARLTNNTLIKMDPKTMEPVCDLAESYERISDTEHIFHLRKGVKFHHGKEFDAEDVVASIENAKKYPGSTPYVGQIEKVEAIDKYTVKFTMLQPYPNLLYDLAFKVNFILPADLLKSGHDFETEPVGTGPYKLVGWKKGESLTYERFDDYFNKEEMPKIKTIIWRVIPEGTSRTIALEAGEVDLVYEVETADIWKKYNAKHLGRIYCEEFHIACYEAFSFGKMKVNLARSLTQDGDDRCVFNHTYRPENLTEEERRLSFEEYDEGYTRPDISMPKPQGKPGFNMLWVKMYYYLLESAVEHMGDWGRVLVGNGLRKAAVEQANVFAKQAAATERYVDRLYIQQHLPLNMCIEEEPLWDTYDKYGAKQLLIDCFYRPFLREVKLKGGEV
jgi:hypothetical protein